MRDRHPAAVIAKWWYANIQHPGGKPCHGTRPFLKNSPHGLIVKISLPLKYLMPLCRTFYQYIEQAYKTLTKHNHNDWLLNTHIRFSDRNHSTPALRHNIYQCFFIPNYVKMITPPLSYHYNLVTKNYCYFCIYSAFTLSMVFPPMPKFLSNTSFIVVTKNSWGTFIISDDTSVNRFINSSFWLSDKFPLSIVI